MVQDLGLNVVAFLQPHWSVQAWSNSHLNSSQRVFASLVQTSPTSCEWQSNRLDGTQISQNTLIFSAESLSGVRRSRYSTIGTN